MALLVANLTASDVVISASNAKRAVTVPAKVGSLTYGPPVDVTSELNGLTGTQYTALEAQRAGGGSPPVVYYWSNGIPLFAVGTLTVAVNLGVPINAFASAFQSGGPMPLNIPVLQ